MITLTLASWMVPVAITLLSIASLLVFTWTKNWATGLVAWVIGWPIITIISAVAWIVWALLK